MCPLFASDNDLPPLTIHAQELFMKLTELNAYKLHLKSTRTYKSKEIVDNCKKNMQLTRHNPTHAKK